MIAPEELSERLRRAKDHKRGITGQKWKRDALKDWNALRHDIMDALVDSNKDYILVMEVKDDGEGKKRDSGIH